MAKKKIDPRIRTLIENNVHQQHRSFFVLVGDHGKDQVPNLHYILSKSQVAKRPNVLWCYKKDLGFSSHRQKRIKQMQKMKQLGIAGQDGTKEEDPFEMFLTGTDIRYTYYSETDKILGSTFGMCVLQDFEALTPNLLARTIETVQGGGMVVLLLKTLTSLKQLYSMVMDVHSRYRTETKHEAVARFNERFLLSLSACDSCLVLDDELNVLPIFSSSKEIVALPSTDREGPKTADELALLKLKQDLAQDDKQKLVAPLVGVAKTLDQAKVVQSFGQLLQDHKNCLRTTVSLTAARGRGKSSALGLALAGAVSNGFGNIFVTAPSPENLRTLFEFLFKGLDALGYAEHMDYDVIQSANEEFSRAVVRVNIFKADHRQTIMYVQPQDAHLVSQAELVLIDEAAAIPLPLVQALSTGSHLVFMASTINGYEGTGRSLSLKLIQQLRAQSTNAKDGLPQVGGGARTGNARLLRELQLTQPIRYAANDPVEKWLNALLCLDVTAAPAAAKAKAATMPHPDKCELYAINRDTLFSYHRASEVFLQRMMALYVASHYKNTPNDLQLMSDAPAHRLYVLLAPVDERSATSLPEILCVLQVCHEGQISKQVILNNLARGKRAGGDLIPWTISQQFQDDDFASLSGARVVRVAVHPDMQNMGYGSRALRLLEQFYRGQLFDVEDEADAEGDEDDADYARPAVDAGAGLHSETLKPRTDLKPLLVRLSQKRPIRLHWLGTSFGLTPPLFKFWKRLGLLPIYLRQTTNDITGEHTMIMLKPLCSDAQVVHCSADWLAAFYDDFRKRFVNLLGFQFRAFSPALCLDVLEDAGVAGAAGAPADAAISAYDLKRLEAYAGNMVDYHMVMDLVPGLAREYFLAPPAARAFSLSPVQAAILLALGLQQRIIEDLEKELRLPVSQLLAMFIKCVRKFAAKHRAAQIKGLEDAEAPAKPAPGPDPSPNSHKRALDDAEAWDPTEQGLDEELGAAADEATQRLRAKQRDLINSLDLDQFRIAGTEAEWSQEIAKKAKNLTGAVMNISSADKPAAKKGKSAAKEVMAEAKVKKHRKTLKR